MAGELTREQRIRLLEFLCGLAWADAAIQPQERQHLQNLAGRLGLMGPDLARIMRAIDRPAGAAALSMDALPAEEQRLFLLEAERLAAADQRVLPGEKAVIERLRGRITKA